MNAAIKVTVGWMFCNLNKRSVRCLKSETRWLNNLPICDETAQSVVSEINDRRKALGLPLIVLSDR